LIKKILITLFIATLFFILAPVLAGDVSVNDIPDYSKADAVSAKYGFTLQEEIEIGFQLAVVLAKRYGYFNNPKVNAYINRVGQGIAKKVTQRPDIEYSFYILDTDEINAFGVPGGFIFITRGALTVISNEAELAGVLAHEIAHVELGHGLEAIANSPDVWDKVQVLKLNLQKGEGVTQETFKNMILKEKELNKGFINHGDFDYDIILKANPDGTFDIK
jgi:predicted Zn-dependent protease